MKVAYWPGCVSRGFTPELLASGHKAQRLRAAITEDAPAACCVIG